MDVWQTKQQLTDLLVSLVRYPSVTGTDGERVLAEQLYFLLSEKDYFKENPDQLTLHPLQDGRQLLTGLVKKEGATDTVILLSHFDVVGTEDYGSFKNLAFHPRELTTELKKRTEELPLQAREDLASGEWLFGRGTMDMKAGICIHLSMLERAMNGEFEGNILFVSVPDEEVNSFGMLAAMPVLNKLKKEHNLEYRACLNGEPVFSRYPGDENLYIYTGSVGKVLPGFLCYGKETHAGEPFAGLNANLINSFLTLEMELNETFIEKAGSETTPPPVSLMQRDLKEAYSVQTPTSAISMYNVLYMKQSLEELNEKLLHAAENAGKAVASYYKDKVEKAGKAGIPFTQPDISVKVVMYRDLYELAVSRYGRGEVERRLNLLTTQREEGDRDFSTLLVQELASLCKDMAPMIVLFFNPPFYPSVSSYHDPYMAETVKRLREYTRERQGIELKEIEFFPGLSDLSYIGPVSSKTDLSALMRQIPLQGKGFQFPEETIEELTVPVLNVGPLGRDPHQWTERLELAYSFESLPDILSAAIGFLLDPERR